jgi:hypothetical protein
MTTIHEEARDATPRSENQPAPTPTLTPTPTPTLSAPGGAAGVVSWPEWRLVQQRYGALRDVVLEEQGGMVYLRGRVHLHYLKQVALATACDLAGPRSIINQIEVVPDPPQHPAAHRADRLPTEPSPASRRPVRRRSAPTRPDST